MKKIILILTLLIFQSTAFATLTVNNVPVTKTGGTTPVLQNSDITDISGNVGIGSTAPANALDVAGSGSFSLGVIVGSGTTQLYGVNNNLGIGTTVPAQALDVSGTVRMTGLQVTTSPGSGKVLTSDASGNASWGTDSGTNYWQTSTGGNIGIGTTLGVGIGTLSGNGSLILIGGNVGIGTVNPGAAFSIANGGAATFSVTSSGTTNITGNMTAPNIFGTSSTTGAMTIASTSSASGTTDSIDLRVRNSVSGVKILDNSGVVNVGIASSNPGQTLDVVGTVRISANILNTGITTDATKTDATLCEDTTSHQFYSGSGTLGICLGTSSARYKHDINSLNVGLDEILKLKPISFFYNNGYGDNGGRLQYGLLAEDVVNVIPRLVALDVNDKPNSVDLLGMVPILINSTHQQQNEIKSIIVAGITISLILLILILRK